MLLHTSSHCKQLDMTPHELFIAGWIDIDSPDDPYDEFAPQIRGASTSGKRCADSLRIGVFKNLPSTSALVHCEGGGCCLLLFKSADSMYSISICCRRCENWDSGVSGIRQFLRTKLSAKNINEQTACETLVGSQGSLSRSMWKELAKFLDGEHTFAGGGVLICAW